MTAIGCAGLLVERPQEAAVADEHAILVDGDAAMPEPRAGGAPPLGSNFQISRPVSAFTAITFSVGVVA